MNTITELRDANKRLIKFRNTLPCDSSKTIKQINKIILENEKEMYSLNSLCKQEQPYKKIEFYKNISQSKMKEFHELRNNVDSDGYIIQEITTKQECEGIKATITFVKQYCNCN